MCTSGKKTLPSVFIMENFNFRWVDFAQCEHKLQSTFSYPAPIFRKQKSGENWPIHLSKFVSQIKLKVFLMDILSFLLVKQSNSVNKKWFPSYT